MEAFARALRQLPTTIADNAGLDSADIVSTLRAAHGADPSSTRMGVDVIAGEAGDMKELGIFESFKVKQQVCSLIGPKQESNCQSRLLASVVPGTRQHWVDS
jgi:chaperonin GroEL (HSP60 family)